MVGKKNESKGTLKISNDVVMKIAEIAASEVKGVASKGQKLYFGDHSRILGKFFQPIKVTMTKEAAEIDITIMVIKGFKTTLVSEDVQKAVKTAVQNMTGIVVAKVNVGVQDIEIPNTESE